MCSVTTSRGTTHSNRSVIRVRRIPGFTACKFGSHGVARRFRLSISTSLGGCGQPAQNAISALPLLKTGARLSPHPNGLGEDFLYLLLQLPKNPVKNNKMIFLELVRP